MVKRQRKGKTLQEKNKDRGYSRFKANLVCLVSICLLWKVFWEGSIHFQISFATLSEDNGEILYFYFKKVTLGSDKLVYILTTINSASTMQQSEEISVPLHFRIDRKTTNTLNSY